MKTSIAVVALFLVVAPSVSVAQRCAGDNNGDGMTTVDEIVASVDSALNGCGDGVRFVDNGDGTISDYETGLMWEKKADLDGSPVDCTSAAVCPDPHDADNSYTWSDATVPDPNDTPRAPDGTAYTVFLAQLNSGGGFAGKTDWRLPTREELVSIVDYAESSRPVVNAAFDTSCTGSCGVTTCSCVGQRQHWSSSTSTMNDLAVWYVEFGSGSVSFAHKIGSFSVRAVRTGL